jgi:hypothetical protein
VEQKIEDSKVEESKAEEEKEDENISEQSSTPVEDKEEIKGEEASADLGIPEWLK